MGFNTEIIYWATAISGNLHIPSSKSVGCIHLARNEERSPKRARIRSGISPGKIWKNCDVASTNCDFMRFNGIQIAKLAQVTPMTIVCDAYIIKNHHISSYIFIYQHICTVYIIIYRHLSIANGGYQPVICTKQTTMTDVMGIHMGYQRQHDRFVEKQGYFNLQQVSHKQ